MHSGLGQSGSCLLETNDGILGFGWLLGVRCWTKTGSQERDAECNVAVMKRKVQLS